MTEPIENRSPSLKNNSSLVYNDFGSIRDSSVYFLIILVASIIYAKSVVYQYTFFDDIPLMVWNQRILSNLSNISKLFTTNVFMTVTNQLGYYRPVLNLLFMLEMQVSKDSLVVFHVTNILLHIGCSILLYVVFKQLNQPKAIAAAAALLFCAHPLNTSAVVWIPGINDTLMTLLVLASFSMLLRALDTRRTAPLVGHLLFFFLALLTKETPVVLPFLCVAYAFIVRREKIGRDLGIVLVVGYATLLALWFVLRSFVVHGFTTDQSLISLALYWLNNSPAFFLYVGKVFLPFNLSIFPSLTDHSLFLGLISILTYVAAMFLRKPSSMKEICWGLGWFFLFLAPTFISGVIRYEHRAYCSVVGLLFAIVQLPVVQTIDFSRKSRLLGFVAILTFYSVVAMVHSEEFRNRAAFATGAYLKDPGTSASSVALANLFLEEGKNSEAETLLKTAIARDSSMKFIHRSLGDVYAARHEYALAEHEYETAIQSDSLQLYAYIDYGKMCLEIGRVDDAALLWKRSVSVNPEFLIGYQYLAAFYTYSRNNPDSAMLYVKQVQQRGGTVGPELLGTIEENSKHMVKTR